MKDYVIRATAAQGSIRAFAVNTRDIVEKAMILHNICSVSTKILGKVLTVASMMSIMLKGKNDIINIQIKGNGELKGINVLADSNANVKGFVFNSSIEFENDKKEEFITSSLLGKGSLTIIKDMGLKEPYIGQVNLVSDNISENLTYYFEKSEQIPTMIELGVLIDKDFKIKSAGGFIIQLMPNIDSKVLEDLKYNLSTMYPIDYYLNMKYSPENILESLLGNLDLRINEKKYTNYYCNCTREKVKKALISIGKEEILNIINEDEEVKLNCHFCNKNYVFNKNDLSKIVNSFDIV